MTRYVISARKVRGDAFIPEPGPVRFLRVPDDAVTFSPDQAATNATERAAWSQEVQGLADGDENPHSISPRGDVLVVVHGFNNDPPAVLWAHDRITANLRAEGWRGLVVSFDWPSDNKLLNYYEDRSDGAAVAGQLVKQCIGIIAYGQAHDCQTNVHVLGHSVGAYVIMEAFVQAEKDGELYQSQWRIGQVAFIGGDVSRDSLAATAQWSRPMFRRIMRLTNYSNPNDSALAVSNAKRLGTEPRAGRRGLPADVNQKAVNVDCGAYFVGLDPPRPLQLGWSHTWYFTDRVFARDLAMTLEGAIDREAIPTRTHNAAGDLVLVDRPRPPNMDLWGIKDPGILLRNQPD